MLGAVPSANRESVVADVDGGVEAASASAVVIYAGEVPHHNAVVVLRSDHVSNVATAAGTPWLLSLLQLLVVMLFHLCLVLTMVLLGLLLLRLLLLLFLLLLLMLLIFLFFCCYSCCCSCYSFDYYCCCCWSLVLLIGSGDVVSNYLVNNVVIHT